MLGPVDHALQNAAVPAEELNRETVLVFGAVRQPPLKGEMARPRDIPARPVLIGVKLLRNIQTRLVHEEQYGLVSEAWDKFGVRVEEPDIHSAHIESALRFKLW